MLVNLVLDLLLHRCCVHLVKLCMLKSLTRDDPVDHSHVVALLVEEILCLPVGVATNEDHVILHLLQVVVSLVISLWPVEVIPVDFTARWNEASCFLDDIHCIWCGAAVSDHIQDLGGVRVADNRTQDIRIDKLIVMVPDKSSFTVGEGVGESDS